MISQDNYTYDDILIKPQYSEINSRKSISLQNKLTKKITLQLPIISSNMDTITEDTMAIEMAKLGGLGIIHRYCSIEQQVEMVKKVKRYTNWIIKNPYTVSYNTFMHEVIYIMKKNKIKSLLVVDNDKKLCGIITNRDIIKYYSSPVKENVKKYLQVHQWMEKDLITITEKKLNEINRNITEIIYLLTTNKIQKLPVVNKENEIKGLITLKDMLDRTNQEFKSKANLDENSQLRVGCAIGVNKDYLDRAKAVIKAGCDIICIDIAHGHHKLCGDTVKHLKRLYPKIDIIAGNVCTAKGTKYLIDCGADCIKVGIGPGSICITRKQTGCGSPQFSAVLECAKVAKKMGVTVIADGGHNGTIGNIFKALCAGACASMLGGMLSGTLETPGPIYTRLNKKVKQIRGMAGILSNYHKSSKLGEDTSFLEKITPEGVEGYVPYKGPVKDILQQIEGGIRSGLSYVGCPSLYKLKDKKINFLVITNNGYRESGSHNIQEI